MNTETITSMTSGMTNGLMLLTIVPFIITGIALFLWGWRGQHNASKSQSWPGTMGRIVSANVEQSRGSEGTTFYPQIIFEYDVQGQRLQSNKINFGAHASYGMISVAQNKILQYPAGRLVQVFYNPENPTEAVLERSANGASKVLMIAGMFTIFLTVCIGGAVMGFTSFFGDFVQSMTAMALK